MLKSLLGLAQRYRQRLPLALSSELLELESKNAALRREVAALEQAVVALRRNDSRFQRLAGSGIIGILTADREGRVLDANDAFLSMLGYTREDLRAQKLVARDMTPPEWMEADGRAYEQLASTGIVPVREKEYLRKDGTRVPALVGGAMLDGDEAECVAFIVDVSERKRAQAALELLSQQQSTDAKFRALLDTAPDAIVVVDDSEQITFVNVRTETLFGYARDELIGQTLELLIPERFRGEHAKHVARFYASPTARTMGQGLELRGRRKDGSELPIEVSLSPLRTAQGLTVSAAIRDISERKRMEAASKLVSERLASAVESIQDAFALFDHEDRYVLGNSVYRKLIGDAFEGALVGKSYEQLLDAWIDDIAFADDAERAGFRAERLAGRRHNQTLSYDLRMRDGRSLRVIDRRTPEGGTVKTIWDLTEDVELAEELREARIAAESASNAKSEFLSSMSHELRTPLNAILGFAQLLQRDKKEPLSPRHNDRVAQILKGGQHLLRLIDDILDLSRIEAGGVSISTEPLSLIAVLEEVQATLGPMAAPRGISIGLEGSFADLPQVAADRTRFVQILMNFGSNAIKYNRPQGTVTLAASTPRPGSVRVTVRDTGWGIPADKQAKLFQPFQRAGQEAGAIEGTGIGLFITKRLAALMHGEVGFSSVVDVGSEFWVDMPAHESSVAHASVHHAVKPELSPGHAAGNGRRLILYVEDNPANVAFIRDLVTTFDDLEFISAPTAEIGVELACVRQPQLIVMDINLPGVSGVEALRMLRASAATQHIPVIALTAAASERDKQSGTLAGFYRYLTKPVDVDEFTSVLEELLIEDPAHHP